MSYSQFGQDKWVCEYLNNKRNGYFLDIGAYDGVKLSNTYYMEKELGWNGILVEPQPDQFSKLTSVRKSHAEQACIVPKDGPVELILNDMCSGVNAEYTDDDTKGINSVCSVNGITFDTLFKRYNTPKIIDYMSLDIEGGEYEVLKTFPFENYSIRVITVEHNAHLGKKNQIKRENIYNLLTSKGYFLYCSYHCDDYYVLDEGENKTMNKTQLKKLFEEYTNNIISAGYSMSFEATLYILKKIKDSGVKIIGDYGCSFISVALRTLEDVTIHTFSDNQGNLIKTKEFLQKHNIPADNLNFVHDLQFVPNNMDFVVYKFSDTGVVRLLNLDKAYSALNPGGIMYVDDMHGFQQLRNAVNSLQETEQVQMLNVQTWDNFGRYGAIVQKRVK